MQKKKTFGKYSALLLSPVFCAFTVLAVFARFSLFPFGERTAAWCDMNQQVVPLLCQFKDILEGRSGMLFSFKNAGGMNFLGVFFFFLSSPFSFLVKFVEKKDMLLFANILIILKIMTSAVTSSFYFVKSRAGKGLGTADIILLSFLYSLSGYVMLFYQNVIWLDMMYMFPLLLLSLERLTVKHKADAYSLVMTLMIAVNYYIGYMIVVFVILLAGVYTILIGREADIKKVSADCRRFLSGSLIAAMMSAAVWLPCFIQYLSSGRRSSLAEELRKGSFVTDYDTVLPVIICSSVLVMLSAEYLFLAKRKSIYHRLLKAMVLVMLVPLFIEPVNKMWHTGSYMSFPVRYGFITIFLMLIAGSFVLRKRYEYKADTRHYAAAFALASLAVVLFERTSAEYINADIEALSDYTKTLGGSELSIKGDLRLLTAGVLCVGLIYFLYRKGQLYRSIFMVFIFAAVIIESCGYIRIYMTTAAERNEETYALQRQVFSLADKIDDDGFYRVKTSSKIFDYNMVGAMGYNSIGHYTSLTDEDYMFAMKRLGYTSVWMEVGTCGGTEITDALLDIGYEISHDKKNAVYEYSSYYINKKDSALPLGVVTENSFSESALPEDMSRAEFQTYAAKAVFGQDASLTAEFAPVEGEYKKTAEGYSVSEGEQLIYRIEVKGEKSLYYDCFGDPSNSLSEPEYNSLAVRVNGKTVSYSYPSANENGVLYLGTFCDEKVVIDVSVMKDVSCSSFGLFGVDSGKLKEYCENAETVGFEECTNGLRGSIESDSDKTVLLAVPYTDGMSVKINGKKVNFRRALSCFTAFDIEKGSSDIEISYVPRGFTAGLVISIIGVIVFAAYLIAGRRNAFTFSERTDALCRWTVLFMWGVVTALVYVIPVLLNMLAWKKE